MKPGVYLLIMLLLIPLQASLTATLSIFGTAPDLALFIVYAIGLLTSPREGLFAGVAVGIVQDIHAGGYLGLTGFTRGVIGLMSGMLGRRVLNVANMTNAIFLTVFSLAEGVIIAIFMQIYHGDVPFFGIFFGKLLPRAVYTGLLGAILMRRANDRNIRALIMRKGVGQEVL